MCCVIPPASVSTTEVSRIASSSVVLPWSTWPMIVTTGGRGVEILLAVLEHLRLLLLVGGVLDRDLALDLGGDQLDRLVGERLRDLHHLAEAHHDLDDLGGRDPERLREVPDGDAGRDGDGPGRGDDRLLLALRRGARGGRAPGAVVAAALAAALSMTTRRLRARRARRGRIGRFGLLGPSAISSR